MNLTTLISFLLILGTINKNYGQELLEVRTDKEVYQPGERIWSAFYLNTAQGRADTISTTVYLELLSGNGVIVERVLLSANKGKAEGALGLPANIKKGSYQLRAYTLSWPGNLVPDVVIKNIEILGAATYPEIIPLRKNDSVMVELTLPIYKGFYSLSVHKATEASTDETLKLQSRLIAKDTLYGLARLSGGITIRGMVYNSLNQPEPRADLLLLTSHGDVLKGQSDSSGRFMTNQLFHEDTVEVRIVANNKRKEVLDIELDPPLTLSSIPLVNYKTDSLHTQQAALLNRMLRPVLDSKMLKEVEIKARKDTKAKPRSRMYDVNFGNTIDMKDMPPGFRDVFDVLKGRIAGVQVSDRGISIRNSPFPVLYLVDEIPWETDQVAMIPANWIDFIDVLKGPEAAIYGSKGAGGVIAIYTKSAEFMEVAPSGGVLTVRYPGFQKSQPFRVSDLPENKEVLKTLYWEPCIRITDGTIRLRFPGVKGELYKLNVVGRMDDSTSVKGSYVFEAK